MTAWDRQTPQQLAKHRTAALRRQLVDVVGPFSPYWRERLKQLGTTPAQVDLAKLPAVGERDLCPDGDPAGAAALVVQAKESGYALHAEGPVLRKALVRRLAAPGSYRQIVEADTRPTSFVWAGLGLRFPVASTRSDLDVVARAGARLWQVLGLSRADVVVSALPLLPTAAAQALELGALAASSPLLAPGDDVDDVAEALRLVPATVLVLPVDAAADLLDDLDDAGAPLTTLTTVVLVGAPYAEERAAVGEALQRVGAKAVVLGVHVPDGHRLAWGECRASAGKTGLHTYPDLEVVETVDPETGEQGKGELVVSQLGLRGSALLRWRTGDLVEAVQEQPCPSCGRTVPRVVGTQRGALVPRLALRDGDRAVDLRGVAGALTGRSELRDWRVVVGRSPRDGTDELLVHVVPMAGVDESDVAVGVARDVRSAAGLLPTQVVVDDALPEGQPVSRRVLVRG